MACLFDDVWGVYTRWKFGGRHHEAACHILLAAMKFANKPFNNETHIKSRKPTGTFLGPGFRYPYSSVAYAEVAYAPAAEEPVCPPCESPPESPNPETEAERIPEPPPETQPTADILLPSTEGPSMSNVVRLYVRGTTEVLASKFGDRYDPRELARKLSSFASPNNVINVHMVAQVGDGVSEERPTITLRARLPPTAPRPPDLPPIFSVGIDVAEGFTAWTQPGWERMWVLDGVDMTLAFVVHATDSSSAVSMALVGVRQ